MSGFTDRLHAEIRAATRGDGFKETVVAGMEALGRLRGDPSPEMRREALARAYGRSLLFDPVAMRRGKGDVFRAVLSSSDAARRMVSAAGEAHADRAVVVKGIDFAFAPGDKRPTVTSPGFAVTIGSHAIERMELRRIGGRAVAPSDARAAWRAVRGAVRIAWTVGEVLARPARKPMAGATVPVLSPCESGAMLGFAGRDALGDLSVDLRTFLDRERFRPEQQKAHDVTLGAWIGAHGGDPKKRRVLLDAMADAALGLDISSALGSASSDLGAQGRKGSPPREQVDDLWL